MQKKNLFILGGFALVLSAVLVYAWATDTDGGYNITKKGICTDQFGNHTDYCLPPGNSTNYSISLVEYYPVNDTNSSYCGYATVNCVNAGYLSCLNGKCSNTIPA